MTGVACCHGGWLKLLLGAPSSPPRHAAPTPPRASAAHVIVGDSVLPGHQLGAQAGGLRHVIDLLLDALHLDLRGG